MHEIDAGRTTRGWSDRRADAVPAALPQGDVLTLLGGGGAARPAGGRPHRDGRGVGFPPTPWGRRARTRTCSPLQPMTFVWHLMNMIAEGVFASFPDFKVVSRMAVLTCSPRSSGSWTRSGRRTSSRPVGAAAPQRLPRRPRALRPPLPRRPRGQHRRRGRVAADHRQGGPHDVRVRATPTGSW